MTTEFIAKKAVEMTILDAIAKGCTTASDAVEYMKTKHFKSAAKRYVSLLEESFPELAE